MIPTLDPKWRWPLGLVSGAVLAFGLFGYAMVYREDVAAAHRALMQAGGGHSPPALTYVTCLQQSPCSAWLSDALSGEFSPLWTGVLGLGIAGLLSVTWPQKKKNVYPGGFALRQQLNDLRIGNWRTDRNRRSLPTGRLSAPAARPK